MQRRQKQKRTGTFRQVGARAEVARELRRIHAVARNHDVTVTFRWFHRDRRLAGESDGSHRDQWVRMGIDPWKEIVGTFVHEILHHLHPDWGEGEVKRFERRVVRLASPAQLRRLLVRCLACWQGTLAQRHRGKRMHACPFCGQGIAHRTLANHSRVTRRSHT